jgi:hypothetical protein
VILITILRASADLPQQGAGRGRRLSKPLMLSMGEPKRKFRRLIGFNRESAAFDSDSEVRSSHTLVSKSEILRSASVVHLEARHLEKRRSVGGD